MNEDMNDSRTGKATIQSEWPLLKYMIDRLSFTGDWLSQAHWAVVSALLSALVTASAVDYKKAWSLSWFWVILVLLLVAWLLLLLALLYRRSSAQGRLEYLRKYVEHLDVKYGSQSFVQVPGSAGQQATRGLTIRSALLWSPRGKEKVVTNELNRFVSNNALYLKSCESFPDIDENVHKYITVQYVYNGRNNQVTTRDDEALYLPTPSDIGVIGRMWLFLFRTQPMAGK